MRRVLLLAGAVSVAALLSSCTGPGPIEVKDPPYVRQPALNQPAPPPTPGRTQVTTPASVRPPGAFPYLVPVKSELIVSTPFPWRYIVLHHSATPNGNAAEFDAQHRRKGWDGLGYDFVIGNGRDSGDGQIEVGYRWRGQLQGAHAGNYTYNRYGIGICLVGNFENSMPSPRQLEATAELVAYLMLKFRIPPQNVTIHRAFRDTACPGRRFPLNQILADANRILVRTR